MSIVEDQPTEFKIQETTSIPPLLNSILDSLPSTKARLLHFAPHTQNLLSGMFESPGMPTTLKWTSHRLSREIQELNLRRIISEFKHLSGEAWQDLAHVYLSKHLSSEEVLIHPRLLDYHYKQKVRDFPHTKVPDALKFQINGNIAFITGGYEYCQSPRPTKDRNKKTQFQNLENGQAADDFLNLFNDSEILAFIQLVRTFRDDFPDRIEYDSRIYKPGCVFTYRRNPLSVFTEGNMHYLKVSTNDFRQTTTAMMADLVRPLIPRLSLNPKAVCFFTEKGINFSAA